MSLKISHERHWGCSRVLIKSAIIERVMQIEPIKLSLCRSNSGAGPDALSYVITVAFAGNPKTLSSCPTLSSRANPKRKNARKKIFAELFQQYFNLEIDDWENWRLLPASS
jgi:hypothetical protein